MASKNLESGAVGVFCESIAVMLDAGIQTEEALGLLGDSTNDSVFQQACQKTYEGIIARKPLAQAMKDTGMFPDFAVQMVHTGETSGRLDSTLTSLARYYNEEDRLLSKLHTSVMYPVALFALMSVILIFTMAVIMPVFLNTYQEVSGGLAGGSFGFVSIALVIGWVALILALLGTVATLVVAFMTKSQGNLHAIEGLLGRLPLTRDASQQLALSRFTTVLTSYASVGMPVDEALERATATVDEHKLRERLNAAVADMQDPHESKSLAQAMLDNEIYGPVYARMLKVGDTSGRLEEVLDRMSDTFFEDALVQMDESLDRIEPALTAFLTITVGAAMIAVMVPLIGILGSIG